MFITQLYSFSIKRFFDKQKEAARTSQLFCFASIFTETNLTDDEALLSQLLTAHCHRLLLAPQALKSGLTIAAFTD